MAIKKSELYSSLWASCDELRGGMDASQYKDYVLVLLFIKYISDKYAGQPFAPIKIPAGASFADMVAMKGNPEIGDRINKHVLRPLEEANRIRFKADFNDAALLGQGKEMVEKLGNLIAIFENPALDFSRNRADGDDILGDAYEYLMRHFATESGKSKGQFYTPAEVSRIIAHVIGIHDAKTSSNTTVYDPTCGSGSLLLKVADAATTPVTLYGQEKDEATSGLAQMNMVLHNNAGALIQQGNTLADPKFLDGSGLKTFDYVVANPPFSDKRWSTGLNAGNDPFGRFEGFGVPPAKQGDYSYLLHIVRSLKPHGKAACILPHGVLFRGNAEAEIRRNLVRRGYIKGIIGLPANLFYGTGIPACIVVIDKQDAQARRGIFMVDASQGFIKEGPKNRLREQDIHRIVDVFSRQDASDPTYARLVPLAELEKNDFNLNLPRYLESRQIEDRQDIEGHLKGGIPAADVDALAPYWATCPALRTTLFAPDRPGYVDLAVDKAAIKASIHSHPEFAAYMKRTNAHFDAWRKRTSAQLKKLVPGFKPKALIVELSEDLLAHFRGQPLLDAYDVYQRLMDLWADVWQDDAYLLAADGWKAATHRVIETKKGKDGKPDKQVDKGWACDLVPKEYIVARYYANEQARIDSLRTSLDALGAQLAELEEEHGGDEGVFGEMEKIDRANVSARLKELAGDSGPKDEADVLRQWLSLSDDQAGIRKSIRTLEADLDRLTHDHYPRLTGDEVKSLVVDDKWLAAVDAAVHREMDRVSQRLTIRVNELGERYATPLSQLIQRIDELESQVSAHLGRMVRQGRRSEFERPGYKQTDLGLLPEDWNVIPIGQIAQCLIGLTYSPSDVHSFGTLVLRSSNVQNYRLAFDDNVYVQMDLPARVITQEGDILICVRNGSRQLIGKCALIDRHTAGSAFGAFMAVLRSESSSFLFQQFQSRTLKKQIEEGMGATINQITNKDLAEFDVVWPSSEHEINAIATILSDMDEEIAALEARLAKTRDLKQGMAQALLTGRIRLVPPAEPAQP